MWVNGIITQLTSIPEDIRIEKWIYGNYPEIREMQKSALENQSKEIGDAISPKIKQMTPEFVYAGSGVINYYFLKSLEDIIKTDTLGAMENASFYQLAVKLIGEIREKMEAEDTLANSIAISKFLADRLGFGRWFKWKDFEDIPEGYEEEIYY